MELKPDFKSFAEFWPFYLAEHKQPITKLIHFIGTSLGIIAFLFIIYFRAWWGVPVALVGIYGPLFASHFIFEKNRPATFRNPIWSVFADLKMWWSLLTGKIKFR
jgi:hypothetical protein